MDAAPSRAPPPACPFPPDALPLPPTPAQPPAAALPEQYTLPHSKAIDLIGEEFVVRSLKTEPSEAAPEPAATRPSVVMSVSSATGPPEPAAVVAREVADQSSLVYCNLNDLDFAGGAEGGAYGGGMQEMIITSSSSGLLQMVQSVPCFQVWHRP